MNRFIIEKYINKLTKQDIINYTNKQNINLSTHELDIIYDYIKNKYTYFLNGHQQKILQDIKNKVNKTTYKKIEELYNTYKNKI